MNIQNYDPEIIALIETVFDQKKNLTESVLRTLPRLMKAAREIGDYTLQGFVHFHTADALYLFEKDYAKFRRHLARAIFCFRLGGEQELLARAYNYVAIDAMNNGSYDVAYQYLMNALQICEKINNVYVMSIVCNNMGQVFARMRNYRKALRYVRLGNRLQARCGKEDFYFYQNMISGYFSEGMLCALMGDLAGAERSDRKIAKLEKETDISEMPSVFIPIAMLRLMIAIHRHDAALCEACSRDVIEKIGKAHRVYDYITDIDDLCHFLIEHNYLDTVRTILDNVSGTVEATSVVQMKKIISAIEIDYCEKRGDKEQLAAHLYRQHELAEQQQLEQNRIYQYSIDLIDIMREQNREYERIQQENETLQTQVQTDALTGIPNRLVFDRALTSLFSRAAADKQHFGVCLMDIDRFKEYNDTYGHPAGDVCLKRVALAIREVADRPGLHCARYGGDEFVMLYENMTDAQILEVARELEEKIRSLDIPHSGAGKRGRVSVSQGICNSVPVKKSRPGDFLAEADNALYAVKKNLDRRGRSEQIRLVHLFS